MGVLISSCSACGTTQLSTVSRDKLATMYSIINI